MNCEICYNPYDHSNHKPYVLSCPHTFCISCINQLNENKCPVCNIKIFVKNPNIALLNFIPESLYDKQKISLKKTLNEISDIKNGLKLKSEHKLIEYLNKLNSTRNKIKSETSTFIELVKTNEAKLLNEVDEIELNLKAYFSLSQEELETVKRLTTSKQSVENNSIGKEELTHLVDESNSIKKKINDLDIKVEEFKENIEFTVYENVSLKDGIIGEIQTNKKRFKKFVKLTEKSEKQKNYAKAMNYINKASEICPANLENKVSVLNRKANLLSLMGKHSESLNLYHKCVELDPNNVILYYNKARVLIKLERYEEALDAINIALVFDSNDIQFLNSKGKILASLKKYDDAINKYDKSIELNPENDYSFKLKGDVYAEMKNFQEALVYYNKALELKPGNAKYLSLKGKSLKHLNKINEAIRCYDQAINEDDNYAPAYFLKSEYFYEQNDYESALSYIEIACEIDPLDSSYKTMKNNILRGIRGNESSKSTVSSVAHSVGSECL